MTPIIVVCGPPCSGKSTFGELVAAKLKGVGQPATHLSVDRILTELLPESDRNVRDRTIALNTMHQKAVALHSEGRIPILDSTYTRRQAREQLQQSCGHIPFFIVEMSVSVDIALTRFDERGRHDAVDQTHQSVHRAVLNFPWSEQPGILKIDSTSTTAIQESASLIESLLASDGLIVDLAIWVRQGLPG
jgi:predicted kinase